ncbi:E6 [Colobus guereza papillomavirus 1]|uniref:Protein E6 n=1 Tax=Colobus guereza papillomavirus 1 TaxID=2759889 RepID=F8QPQ1_9PAPI|nr:E6 [Colobus guereza papillomavirus 1]
METYISRTVCVSKAAMSTGDPYPKNVFLLCKNYDLDLENLQLNCIFCCSALTNVEVVSFAYKELNLVWKDQFPHGACAKCLVAAGKLRQFRHWQYSCYASTVEKETGKSIAELFMRCYLCHKPLCSVEKNYIIEGNLRFHKIADYWRGACLHCRRPCTDDSQL